MVRSSNFLMGRVKYLQKRGGGGGEVVANTRSSQFVLERAVTIHAIILYGK